jgi:hypothetical protein
MIVGVVTLAMVAPNWVRLRSKMALVFRHKHVNPKSLRV